MNVRTVSLLEGPGSQPVPDEYLQTEGGSPGSWATGQVTASVPALLSEDFKLDILLFFCLELECGLGVNEHFFPVYRIVSLPISRLICATVLGGGQSRLFLPVSSTY